jgi:hypothetical protein
MDSTHRGEPTNPGIGGLKARAHAAYAALGIPRVQAEAAETTRESFLQLLVIAQHNCHGIPGRLLPASFNAGPEAVAAFPRMVSWEWKSLHAALRQHKSVSVLSHLPLFWQVEPVLSAACKNADARLYIGDSENLPVSAASLPALSIDTVISETAEAAAFASYLSDKGKDAPPAWILIHRAGDEVWETPAIIKTASTGISRQVHLFPGVPILEQCTALAESASNGFHADDSYLWEFSDEATYISSVDTDIVPLYRFRLDDPLRVSGMCACGKEILERAV